MLVGQQPNEALFREAAEAASQDLDPHDDIHATAQYRRQVGAVLARRAMVDAASRVQGEQG
jgi:carbon-monoxide dehydrogenase medium subunit